MKLSYFHHNKKGTPPRLLRNRIHNEMKVFPLNLQMVFVYIECESRTPLFARLRKYFDCDLCPKSSGSLPWLLAINAETGLGCASRIKSLFENALRASNPTKRSAALWHQYILFEVSRQNWEAAKNVLYRAIRAVPWYKEIWLAAIDALGGYLHISEIMDILNLMVEKELRLRVDLPIFDD